LEIWFVVVSRETKFFMRLNMEVALTLKAR